MPPASGRARPAGCFLQCPFCRKFALEIAPELKKRFVDEGKVQQAFWHLPIEAIHHEAFAAAVAAECAGDQGRFWEMHANLFDAPKDLSTEKIAQIATRVGLSEKLFAACVAKPETAALVKDSVQQAQALQIRSTPTFFVGRRTTDGRVQVTDVIRGAQPVTEFVSIIEKAVASATQVK